MQRRLLCVLAATVVAVALFTGAAFASGPAAPGKEIIHVTCGGIEPLTVSVPRSEKNTGAGQIVGEKGHGIEVTFTRILTDLKTKAVLSIEPERVLAQARRSSRKAKKYTFQRKRCFAFDWTVRCGCVCGRDLTYNS